MKRIKSCHGDMRKKLWQFTAVAVCLSGCGLSAPQRGELALPGVGLAIFETRANATDIVRVLVFFPSEPDGRPKAGPFPAMVYVQGGFVPSSRYAWQAEALAAQGYVVAMPDHLLDLAFFSIENGEVARQLLVRPPPGSLLEGLVDSKRVAVAGHSLGGVVAFKLALLGGFRAIVVEASFSDSADDSKIGSLGMPSLFLAGALDCQAKLTQVEMGWAKMPSPTALVVLPGMTHYGFTDTDADDAKRCPPQAPIDASHARIVAAMTGFLEAAFDPNGASVGEVALRAVDGVEVTTR